MKALIRSTWVQAGLFGCLILLTSCSSDEHNATPASDLDLARQAEQLLLQTIPIESGTATVVSFVGPVPPGTSLVSAYPNDDPARITVPLRPGVHYLCFINKDPNLRYVHPVWYVWLNLTTRTTERVEARFYPKLESTPPDTTQFELIEADTLSGIIFYYGRGGGLGFPPAYLPEEGP